MSWAEVHDEAEQLEHVVSERLDRAHRRNARTADPRSARRSHSDARGHHPRGSSREPADLSGRHAAQGHADRRSGSRLPALHRAQSPEARPVDRSRNARCRRRRRAACAARTGRRSPSAPGRPRSCSSRSTGSDAPARLVRRPDRDRDGADVPSGFRAGQSVRHHRQLVPGRRSVQPGTGRLPEHLRVRRATRPATGQATSPRSGRCRPCGINCRTRFPSTAAPARRFMSAACCSTTAIRCSEEGPGRPAFSPRVSLILPTGIQDDDTDHTGLQVNLPFSKQEGRFYLHGNAGFTWLHDAELDDGQRASLTSPVLAGSVIWAARPLFNLLLESGGGIQRQRRLARHQRHALAGISMGLEPAGRQADRRRAGGARDVCRRRQQRRAS